MIRHRAPFIWTSKQPVNPTGFLAEMQGLPQRDEGPNRWFLFRKEVALDDAPSDAAIDITVDGRYQLFVNGRFVGRGPVRSDVFHQKYDSYGIRPNSCARGPIVSQC